MTDILCIGLECGDAPLSALGLARIMFSGLLAVLFLQSGIDKVSDRQGNIGWLTEHFASSPLAGLVPAMLATVAVVELAAGFISGAGVIAMLFYGSRVLAVTGALAGMAALLMLFFGQRLAKDYEGAAVLAGYFTLMLVGLYLLQL